MHFKKSVLKNHLLYSIITLMAIAMLFPITAFANVATHELGHALGLDHSTSTDVMDAAITGHTSTQALSQNDKDSYDAAYNNY